MRQETLQSIVKGTLNGQKYDESCKEVFKHREIIAPILKFAVEELADCTQEEIIRLIDAESIKEIVPVDELPSRIKDHGTEMSAVFEKTIFYDVHFKVKNPILSSEMISIMLHIDFEVQNDFRPRNPRYPVIKRAVYYAAREISSQLSKLTQKTNYSDIEKVYSIWVCNENIPLDLQNTVTRYTIKKEDIVGQTSEAEEEYDLMEVILIRRGSETADNYIFRYLESIFKSDIDRIKEYVGIPMDSEIEKEIAHMTGLGESLYNKAYNEASKETIKEVTIKLLKKNYKRNIDVQLIIQDLQEELDLNYEDALTIFEKEIKD